MKDSRLRVFLGALMLLALLLAACAPAAPSPEPPSAAPEPSLPPVSSPPPVLPPPAPPPLPSAPTTPDAEFERTLANHFGFMPAMWDFAAAGEAGGAYDRPFFELFQWDMVEREPGRFDFFETDRYVLAAQAEGFHILANIQPFAHWDQRECHQDLPAATMLGDPRFGQTRGKPCDMERYRDFLSKLVERYDGDGADDMQGLTIPIKHWEVMNEPEFQEEPLVFFQGSPQDYFEVLKASYEEVKAADPTAVVVQGGMAGMMAVCTDFWQAVFDLGGAQYFDIANMHSIGHGEHLNIPAFKQFLDGNGIADRPIWVTEVQYQQAHQTEGYTAEDFAGILARSYIFALANGVDKLFYVNVRMPPVRHGVPFDERSALIKDNGEKSPLFYAHLTASDMLGKLGQGDGVEKIEEKIGEWSILAGQYKFNIGGTTVYALWGEGPLPPEIAGEIKVTEISGTQQVIDSATLKLGDRPIFVEID